MYHLHFLFSTIAETSTEADLESVLFTIIICLMFTCILIKIMLSFTIKLKNRFIGRETYEKRTNHAYKT